MDKKQDTQHPVKAATKTVQSSAPKRKAEIEEKPGRHTPDTAAVDRPGFDLGGSTGDTTAGTGLGLGVDAGESRSDRSLPGRHARATLSIPRWSGPTLQEPPPSDKDKLSEPKTNS
ncbi:MAG: hypothetical protein WAK01_02265 [Methylocystis sp.]